MKCQTKLQERYLTIVVLVHVHIEQSSKYLTMTYTVYKRILREEKKADFDRTKKRKASYFVWLVPSNSK